jgi:general secretion pathway protein E
MLDLGIEPYLVASSVAGILAQRLVRRLCPKCTEKVESNSSIRAELGVQMSGFETVYHGRGCDHCFNTGYRGRTGIYELMVMDDNIRQCVCRQDSAGAIKKAALASDFTTLRMDGLRKVEIGETSLDELLRVVHSDEVDVN